MQLLVQCWSLNPILMLMRWTLGIMDCLTKSYVNPMPRLRDTWRGISGIKIRNNVIVHSWTLFYVENCAWVSDLFANSNQGGPATSKTGIGKNGRYRWNHHFGPGGKTSAQNNSPRYTLEVYKKTRMFIPVVITENVVELVTRKLSVVLGPESTES